MLNLLGYQETNLLYSGIRTLVYRANRAIDSLPVIIKVLRNPHPNFNELVKFRNQYVITRNLQHQTIVQPLALERYENSYALVMADRGDICLRDYWQKLNPNCLEFLTIAIQLAEALHYLSQQGIIHKDIKPSNILIHPKTKQVKLIDFSISTLLPKEQQQLISPNVIEGSLAYISPEQTGRMNRGIDYRTDFYSLGVTFFELLTGKLPFESRDPIELVHCHIAKIPPTPDGKLPTSLVNIVLKLMAKNAEDRYQSALGLKHDLEKCLEQLQAKGEIETFELGSRDLCDRFIIPEKLYGREIEVQKLLDGFARVAEGATEMILVAGFSGIGKTAVVNEVYKPIVKQRGYFIKGKFDQFNRNIPLSAFVQAFRNLMGQLLGESNAKLQEWKTQILEAVGTNGQILIDVIPELGHVIGKQPPVSELSGSAAQNRFNLLLQRFIAIFTTKEHPLTIFVDDLQWADSASLNLIKVLIADNKTGYLLLLGAYRDSEVFQAHPLMLTLADLQQRCDPSYKVERDGNRHRPLCAANISSANRRAAREQVARISTITLAPLAQHHINRLVAETLSCTMKLAAPFTKLIYAKTKGNPFFTTQFLTGLYEDQLIVFNRNLGCWECDLVKIQDVSLTDDVVEFMARRLQKLPGETQEVLKLAACIGNQFDLETLAIVRESSAEEVAAKLWRALLERMVLPLGEAYKFFQGWEKDEEKADSAVGYRFLHDRVQQAAYFLIPEEQKKITHFNIGTLLLDKTPEAQLEEKVFDIVPHLNQGIELITSKEKQLQLTELNLLAAQKAKSCTAYITAWEYLETGIQLLKENSWQTHYQLTLNLYTEAVEIGYLKGDLETMEKMAGIVLSHARNILDRVKVYETQLQHLSAQSQYFEAIEVGLNCLKLLRVDLPLEPTPEEIGTWLENTKTTLEGFSDQALIELPDITDLKMEAAMRMLVRLGPPTYFSNPNLLVPLICKTVLLSLEYGSTFDTPFIFTNYGLVLCDPNISDFSFGYRIGKIGEKIINKQNNNPRKALVFNNFYLFISHWVQHYRHSIAPFQEGCKSGLEAGDLEFAGYNLNNQVICKYCVGQELSGLILECKQCMEFCHSIQVEGTVAATTFIFQTIHNLIHVSERPWSLQGEFCNETETIEILRKSNNAVGISIYTFSKLHLNYLFEGDLDVVSLLSEVEDYLDAMGGHLLLPPFTFIGGLIYLSIAGEATDEQKSQYLERAKKWSDRLEFWAGHAPMNYQHKSDLIQAEKCRVLGKKLEAIELYDKAIAGAKENSYIQEEALANELAAKFYLDWGKQKYAALHMQEAYYCYARWGAAAKTNHLEQRYPDLLQPILRESQPSNPIESLAQVTSPNLSPYSSPSSALSSVSNSSQLDFATVLKAAQLLSEKIHIDELLTQFVQLILQNSGADKLVIVLPDSDNAWQVRAIATPETTQLSTALLTEDSNLPTQLMRYVKNTREIISIDDLYTELPLLDTYLQEHQPRSILCLPILHQGNLSGLLYLQNQAIAGLFNRDRILVLNFLCTQAAIALENARLFTQQQQSVFDLQVNNSFLKAQQESSLDGMVVIDSNRQVTAYNERFVSIWNIPKTVLETKDDQQLLAYVLDQLENPTAFLAKVEYLYDHPEESSFDEIALKNQQVLERYSSPIKLPSGEYSSRIWYFRDISDRKRTQSALQLSEARAQATFTQAAVGFVELDLKTKKCVRANDCFCKMVGYTSAELAEMTFKDVTYPDDVAASVEALSQLYNGGVDSFNLEKRYVRKDGTVFWAETTVYLIKPQGGDAIYSVGLIQDISEKKQLEAERQQATVALQNSQARFRRMTENVPGMIYRYVLHADGRDELTYVSSQVRELFEVEPELALQAVARMWERVHPDDVPSLKEAIELSAETLKPLRSEHRLILPQKGLRWMQLFSQPERLENGAVAWDGVIVDVSDRKAAEQELVLKQNHLEALLNNIPHIAWIKDSEGRFVAVNEPLARMMSCSPNDMIGKTDDDFSPIELVHAYREDDLQVMSSGQRKVVEERARRGDGSWGWLETTKTPFRDAQGQIAGTVGIAADISDRKRAEQLLADYNCELERQVEARTRALQESEERLRLALSATNQGFFDVNLHTGEAIVSPEYALMLGYDPATFQETDVTWRSRLHPDDREQTHQSYRAYAAGQTAQYKAEFRMQTQQGDWKWILSVGQFVEWDETGRPTRLLGTHTDISDRKVAEIEREQAEARLRQSEATLLKAQKVAHVGNWEFDIASKTITWSPEMFRIYGLEPAAAPSYAEYLQMLPVETRLRLQQYVERAIREGTPYTIEYSRTRSDGSVRHHECRAEVEQDEQGQTIRIFGTTLDITDLKQTEQALQNLVAGTAATTGEDFFPALVSHISTALDVPIAVVTQFVDQELQTLAFVVDGELQPDLTYDLLETACIELTDDCSYYYCPSGLSMRFPNNPTRVNGMESYLGVALRNSQGQALGSLCILDRRPLPDPERAKQILDVFGSRAAAELERQRAENALQNLIEGTAALTGPDFFAALVRHIATALNASHAFVTELVEGDQLRFLAAWGDGEYLPNDIIDIEGTSCGVVLRQGAYHCKRDLIACFPQNPRLASMGVESYMGVALQNRQGDALGTLCIFARQPLGDREHSEQILRVFAARAAAELERQRAEMVIGQQFAAIEAAIDGISILQNGVYRYVNQAHLNLFGYEQADELVGKSWKCLYSEDEIRRFEQEILPQLSHGQGWQGEAIATRKDGSTFAQGVSLTLTEEGLLISVCRDISDLKQAQALITYNALHDSLTGLPNRTLLLERLTVSMQRAQQQENYRYAVLFLDLDRFKVINDSLGHVVGDQLLIEITQRLKTHLRQTDLVARLGGDEFLILIEDINCAEEVAQIAEQILAACQIPITLNNHQIFTSMSIGIVIGEKDYRQAIDLIRDADIAMYQAKTNGRNSYYFFDAAMHTAVLNKLSLETDLRKAVDQQEFIVYYQPIFELSSRQLTGFEALVRWQHPNQGLTTPDKFIPIAEETGLIQYIDSWVMYQACQQVADWQKQYPKFSLLKISVNLSAQDLCKTDLIYKIDEILKTTGLSSQSVTLEITESLLIDDIEKIASLLTQLTKNGIQISIDDFGTGYSSLSYLHRLPFHSLKIDRSFIRQMKSNSRNHKIVNTIIALGQQLGLNMIAEGIETPQQLQLLRQLGCQFGQGYLFSKPLSAQEIEICFLQGTGGSAS